MPPIRVDRLIEQADVLARRNQIGAGRPRDADLRRAASAAYYALFHALTDAFTRWLAPAQDETDRQEIRRSLSHGGMKKVCSWTVNPGGAPKKVAHVPALVRRAALRPEVADVAQALLDLQASRHEADYDHRARFSKDDVLASIDQASEATGQLRSAESTPEFEAFAVLLALDSRTRE